MFRLIPFTVFCLLMPDSLHSSGVVRAAEEPDILIADFEWDSWEQGGWTSTGDAFGSGPASGTLPGQMHVSGYEGKRLVNSFVGGDKTTGRLISSEFVIERDYIKFLIGGGAHPGETCINLVISRETVLTATGPNKDQGGSEFLNWENWDVRDLRGRTAHLEIVDAAVGGWGHINVDHILQSNIRSEKKEMPAPSGGTQHNFHPAIVREMPVTGKYLLIPVSNRGQQGRLRVTVGDELVHHIDCDFPPDRDSVDWWTFLDMEEFAGQTAVLTAHATPEVFSTLRFDNEILHLQPLYNERLRPQFHFSQMRGWNNDPNGMCYFDGEYHFFWQSNPAGRNWANMYWGHATSTDMIHWTEQKHALRSFAGDAPRHHPAMAVQHCFSGSAHVDVHNTSGWQRGNDPPFVLAFTDTGSGESLAVSHDRGRTWNMYEGNPIIRHQGRDPKLLWYEPGRHWVIAVYDEEPDVGQNIAFYISRNLKDWELVSRLPGYFECAELFELPVDNDPAHTKWVIFAADAHYAIGHFDGRAFVPEHEGKHRVHWGNYYASQCFSNPPDGRVVQIGWAQIDIPDMPFNQAFTLPANLTLRTTIDGIRMFVNPIDELRSLHLPESYVIRNRTLTEQSPRVTLDVADQLFDIEVTLQSDTARSVILQFGRNTVTFDFEKQTLDEMPLRITNGRVSFRILVDRPMFEIIGGDGACYKTIARHDMGRSLGSLSLTAEGGSLDVLSFEAFPMKPIWPRP